MTLKNKKILITGGAGFIGFYLAKELSKKNNVTILDNFSRGKKDNPLKKLIRFNKVKFINCDLNEKIKIKKKFDIIFHLAAIIGVKNVRDNPIKTLQTNIFSTIHLVNFLKKKCPNSKVIFFSTSEIYSNLIFNKLRKFPIEESAEIFIPHQPSLRDSYFLSKIIGEKIIQTSGLKYNILRPHNIYGPRMGMDHVIPQLFDKLKKNKKKFIINSPHHERSFCYTDDAIFQILKIASSKKLLNNTFNIGNPKEQISMLNLGNKIKKIYNSNKKIFFGKVTPGSTPNRVPNIKKLSGILNKYKFTDLNNGLKKTIDWYEKN